MDVQRFKDSVREPAPDEDLGPALKALWWDAKGDWEKAHEFAQQREDRPGMLVHAYLHRKEGDASNAVYWYRRAGSTPASGSLDAEWDEILRQLLPD